MTLDSYLEDLEYTYPGIGLEFCWDNDAVRGPYWQASVSYRDVGYDPARARTQLTALRRAVRYWKISECELYGLDYYAEARKPHLSRAEARRLSHP